jgi:hypothetical protein
MEKAIGNCSIAGIVSLGLGQLPKRGNACFDLTLSTISPVE